MVLAIRRLSEKDTAAVADLLVGYWKERASKNWARKYVEEGHVTEVAYDEFFVAEEGGELAGVLAVIVYEGGVAELRDFVMLPKHRGKGGGETFLSFMLALLERSGARKVFTLVSPETKHFYTRLGFTQEGLLKDHSRAGEHLAVMSYFFRKGQRKLGAYAR